MNAQEPLQPPPDVFFRPLLDLRDYYASLAAEYQRLFIEARTQMDHVDALLSQWSCPDEDEEFTQLEVIGEIAESSVDSPALFSSDLSSESKLNSIESKTLDLEQPKLEHPPTTTQNVNVSDQSFTETNNLDASNYDGTFIQENDHFNKVPDIPMIPPYERLTRMEAIKKLLQEYEGTVCHIDFIVRSLYGELKPTIYRVVKGRVQSSLTQGRERHYWAAIPNEPGCYTLDLNSLGPSNPTFAQGMKSKKKKPYIPPKSKVLPMLRRFEGQFLIDAITSFLEQNPGRVFNVNQVIVGIYGELDSEQTREVKTKVLNELSRGHRTGRFSRVPDKIGLYTWDAKTISRTGTR
ncbi:MAG TPA: hypothetical protein VK184_17965 [Nostocaceae cyanobacterium]|nr:hypothetical protein [Nostocaceae cyanobacterium]